MNGVLCVRLPDLRARAPRAKSRFEGQFRDRALHRKLKANRVRYACRGSPFNRAPRVSSRFEGQCGYRAPHRKLEADRVRYACRGIPALCLQGLPCVMPARAPLRPCRSRGTAGSGRDRSLPHRRSGIRRRSCRPPSPDLRECAMQCSCAVRSGR